MDTNQQQRDIVYCHQCENEWYRSEHGLTCPECHSDFTEIVEAQNDPRQDEQHIPADNVPDPDEQDIEGLRLVETGPNQYRLRGTYRTEVQIGPDGRPVPGQGQGAFGEGGIMGMVGNMLQGMLGPQQPQQRAEPADQAPYNSNRPASAPGSPPPNEQQQRGGNGTFVRSGHGPNYSYTIATSSNAGNFGGGNLFPRNANGPQPFQHHPDNIEQMMAQMFANIGAAPGGGDMRMVATGAPPGHPFHDYVGETGDPFATGGPGAGHGMPLPFNLLNLFGPPGGIAGDAVYSQEALDRIITQLMEQHQTGNAPGPASEAAIRNLSTKKITEADQGNSGKADCSICMDEAELGGVVTVLPCQHWFHHECVKAWLSEHDTCPHCRQGIMPKNDTNAAGPRGPNQAPLNDMNSPEYHHAMPPGAYPFPRTNSGGESPTMGRRNSTGGDRRRSNGSSAGELRARLLSAALQRQENALQRAYGRPASPRPSRIGIVAAPARPSISARSTMPQIVEIDRESAYAPSRPSISGPRVVEVSSTYAPSRPSLSPRLTAAQDDLNSTYAPSRLRRSATKSQQFLTEHRDSTTRSIRKGRRKLSNGFNKLGYRTKQGARKIFTRKKTTTNPQCSLERQPSLHTIRSDRRPSRQETERGLDRILSTAPQKAPQPTP